MTGNRNRSSFGAIIFLIVMVTLSSCNSAPAASEDPTVTPTPTKVMQVVLLLLPLLQNALVWQEN